MLGKVDLILAEDTRVTRVLLDHYHIKTSMHTWNDYNATDNRWIELLSSHTVALVTDAGTPGISDPGYVLVKAALEASIPVEVLPGPSALIPALVGSGLPCDRFAFLGFLPKKSQDIESLLSPYQSLPLTLCYYDSPVRVMENLTLISTHLGDRKVVVARELTKLHETWYRFSLSDIPNGLSQIKGECVVMIEGFHKSIWSENDLESYLATHPVIGPKKDMAKSLSKVSGLKTKDIYQRLIKR